MTTLPRPPEGFRLLESGERVRPATDLYWSHNAWCKYPEWDGPYIYISGLTLPVARRADPEVQAMIGKAVYFNGWKLGVIVNAHEASGHAGWAFTLDNRHCIRDFRGCSGWEMRDA